MIISLNTSAAHAFHSDIWCLTLGHLV